MQNIMKSEDKKKRLRWKLWRTLPSLNKLLLETQILSRKQLINNKHVHIHPQILPNTRPWSNSQSHKWWQHYGFLHRTKNTTKWNTKSLTLITRTHKTCLEYNNTTHKVETKEKKKVTCVDLKTSPKTPPWSFFLLSSGISSNSATTWWCCRIPLPLASSLLLLQQDC